MLEAAAPGELAAHLSAPAGGHGGVSERPEQITKRVHWASVALGRSAEELAELGDTEASARFAEEADRVTQLLAHHAEGRVGGVTPHLC